MKVLGTPRSCAACGIRFLSPEPETVRKLCSMHAGKMISVTGDDMGEIGAFSGHSYRVVRNKRRGRE
ncbi:MAG: hypothetical protein HZB29_09965 [Nitrospinae bacterium]|nr:hypothetical protein [Nitrospinota bacterium]